MIGQTVSHYKIIEKLGEGGMGIVYKAQDVKLDRFVALKFLPEHLTDDKEERARIFLEAKSASALNHPHVRTIHAIEEADQQIFIVMEYVEGKTLKKKFTETPLKVTDALSYAIQIGEALKEAHQKNIIHRDIKPDNILVNDKNKIKVMDFGLAKLKSAQRSSSKQFSTGGTLAYMSPEQIQRGKADHRSDIWSFGVVLYEMLTGELPFKADHEAALLYLIINQEPVAPSSLDRRIPHQFDSVILKMLAKDIGQRYQNADEIIQTLHEMLNDLEKGSKTGRTKAIAVLPFENISTEKESDYFSDGLTEELIANLSRLKDIRVVSRTTSMQYKGTKKDIKMIGKELDVRYLVEGSVRKHQDNLRITAELIEVEYDTQLWAETYKGKMADVFDIQEQVANRIVDALMVKLSPTEKVILTKKPTLDPDAFDYNLRGRDSLYRRTKKDIQFSIQLFKKAIEMDSRYADAYAGLGEAYALMFQDFESKDHWLNAALESALKALMYDPTLSEAYAALGLTYWNKKAPEDALDACNKAIKLDSNNFLAYWILGRIYRTTGRDKEAAEVFRKVLTINPFFYTVYGDLRMTYEKLGEKENLEDIVNAALKFFPNYLTRHDDDARAHMLYALTLVQANKIDEGMEEMALAIKLSPEDAVMLYNVACVYSRLGEKQLAIQALKNSINAGQSNFGWMKRDPDLDNIRNETEYIELMKGK